MSLVESLSPQRLADPRARGGDDAGAAHDRERQQFLDGDACDVRDHDTVAS